AAQLTRSANSAIHQNVAETNAALNLRFVVGKRVGVASTGRLDDEGLRRVTERAGAIARNVEELADWGGLPSPDGAAPDLSVAFAAEPPAPPPRCGPRPHARSSLRPTRP